MNLTSTQLLGIIVSVIAALSGATAQLTDIFGVTTAHTIVSVAGLLNLILGIVLTSLTGQTAQIKAVQAMPGVNKIEVNEQANSTLATLAMDPTQTKVEITPGSEVAVQQTAKTG